MVNLKVEKSQPEFPTDRNIVEALSHLGTPRNIVDIIIDDFFVLVEQLPNRVTFLAKLFKIRDLFYYTN